jgi:hypothetical protein
MKAEQYKYIGERNTLERHTIAFCTIWRAPGGHQIFIGAPTKDALIEAWNAITDDKPIDVKLIQTVRIYPTHVDGSYAPET